MTDALEQASQQPLDGSPLSVDAARAEAWLRDPTAEPVKAWPGAKVDIADVWHKDEIARVKLAGKKAGVDAFDDALKTVFGFLVPQGAADLRDNLAIARLGRPMPLVARAQGEWQTFPYLGMMLGGSKTPIDPAAARVLFANGMDRFAADHAVDGVEWSYGVSRPKARR